MLLLFETSAGYALFKVKSDKLEDATNVYKSFQTSDGLKHKILFNLVLESD